MPAVEFTLSMPGSGNVSSQGEGFIDFIGDTDTYGLNVVAGTTYVFQVNGSNVFGNPAINPITGLSGGTLGDTFLELYSASDVLLASNDDVNGSHPQITFTATSTGLIKLTVREYGNSVIGTYSLTAMVGTSAAGSGTFSNSDNAFTITTPVAGRTYRALGGNDNVTGTAVGETIFGDAGGDDLLGLGGDDILYGGVGDDGLLGGENDDILSGDEGNDWLYGGNGHDTVYYTPYALASGDGSNAAGSQVEGGGGFDTLIIQYAQASAAINTFQLGTQGFERAVLDRFDTGSNSWNRSLYLYDTAWRQTSQEIYYDNNSKEVITFDALNNQAWSRSTNYFNTAGQYYAQRILYDTGAYDTQYIDFQNNQSYSSYIDYVNAGGSQYARRYFQDAGNYDTIYYDFNGTQSWFQQTEFRQADGDMYTRQTNYDNGTYLNEYYDVDGVNSWSYYQELFNSSGVRISGSGTYDDGTPFSL